MRNKNSQANRDDGFTIIEILIVLAIAGLILLIVFLAVPALQRNSRNTQRRNDVASLLSGVGTFVDDNNGLLPDGVQVQGNDVSYKYSGNGSSIKVAKVGFYKGDEVKLQSEIPKSVDVDHVYIVTGAKCNGNKMVEGSDRSYAAAFAVEPKDVQQCQGS